MLQRSEIGQNSGEQFPESESQQMQQDGEEEADEEMQMEDDDSLFDFGKAKMEFFKQRARQILFDDFQGYQEDENMAYEGEPLPLKMCYTQLKSLIKRPAVNYGSAQEKPGYMKMTFAMSRSCAPNSKILQLSNMMNSLDKIKGNGESSQLLGNSKRQDSNFNGSELTLLRQLKSHGSDLSLKPDAFSQQTKNAKKKTKREEQIDLKIEKLLEIYKKKDEQASNKAKNLDADRAMNRRNLLDKYGFSDNEDDL